METAKNSIMIRTAGLTKSFTGPEGVVHALKDINLEIGAGEIYGIIDKLLNLRVRHGCFELTHFTCKLFFILLIYTLLRKYLYK